MRYTISGKNINITPGLKDAVESKLGKLERYFSPDTEVQVTLSVEKGRQKIEVTIPVKGSIIRAEQDSSDMYVSVDLVEEIIERQIKKYKTKIVDKKQNALAFNEAFLQEESEPEETVNIVKTKRFAMKPMDAEEACVQMELLGHNFFMFLNADTNEVNVVYKRKGNSYAHAAQTSHALFATAIPPMEVSLSSDGIDRPTAYMTPMVSSIGVMLLIPAIESSAEIRAFDAPMAFRF